MNANSWLNDWRGGQGTYRALSTATISTAGISAVRCSSRTWVNGKNKLFFFASQELLPANWCQASSVNIRVPTAAERTGDFSQTVDGAGKAIPSSIHHGGRFFRATSFQPAVFTPRHGNSEVPACRQHHGGRKQLQLHLPGAQFLPRMETSFAATG